MSTKIYTGVVFTGASVDAVLAAAPAWRQRIAELTAKDKAEWISRKAVEALDARYLGNEEPESPLKLAWRAYRDDTSKGKDIRHPDTDWEFLLSLMPFEGRLYGIIRTERMDWFGEYCRLPYVSNFQYWNSTDQPKDMDYAEWEERGRIWHAALREFPNLTLDYSNDDRTLTDDDIVAAQPSFRLRVDRLARDLARDFYISEIAGLPEFAGLSDMMAALSAAHSWLDTDGGRQEFERRQTSVGASLPAEATVEMLRATLAEHRAATPAPAGP